MAPTEGDRGDAREAARDAGRDETRADRLPAQPQDEPTKVHGDRLEPIVPGARDAIHPQPDEPTA